MAYEAIVIGVSAGGLAALNAVLPALGKMLPVSVMIVQHLSPESDDYMAKHFDQMCDAEVKEAEDKEPIKLNTIYFAPADYHLMVEHDRTLALSKEAKVNFSRPAIDVLFETAAEVYLNKLIGVILTGASSDGARGMAKIAQFGGATVVQSPETAEVETMPMAALEACEVDHVLPLDELGAFLHSLIMESTT